MLLKGKALRLQTDVIVPLGGFWVSQRSKLHAHTFRLQYEFQQLHGMKTIEAERMRLQTSLCMLHFTAECI